MGGDVLQNGDPRGDGPRRKHLLPRPLDHLKMVLARVREPPNAQVAQRGEPCHEHVQFLEGAGDLHGADGPSARTDRTGALEPRLQELLRGQHRHGISQACEREVRSVVGTRQERPNVPHLVAEARSASRQFAGQDGRQHVPIRGGFDCVG
jgi:hypothetical protein